MKIGTVKEKATHAAMRKPKRGADYRKGIAAKAKPLTFSKRRAKNRGQRWGDSKIAKAILRLQYQEIRW